MTDFAHLLGIPLLVAYLAFEYRVWRRRTSASVQVMVARRDYIYATNPDGDPIRGDWGN